MSSKEFDFTIQGITDEVGNKADKLLRDSIEKARQLKIFSSEIKSAQDNPAITRLGTLCYSMNSSELAKGNPWTSEPKCNSLLRANFSFCH